ncbi:hypothetical protein ACFL4O_01705 [bacterium]
MDKSNFNGKNKIFKILEDKLQRAIKLPGFINKEERRVYKRLNKDFAAACYLYDYVIPSNFYSGEEIITKLDNISKGGVCIKWPHYWKCLICKNRIDLRKSCICEIDNCIVRYNEIPIDSIIMISIQIGRKILRNIEGKVVHYFEQKDSRILFDKVGIRFNEPIDM